MRLSLPAYSSRTGLAASLFCASLLSAHAQNLEVTQGLQLWLKADAGVTTDASSVVTWTDQSPNAHIAGAPDLATAPALVADALNGKPVLRFDGIDDYLSIEDAESLSFTGDMTTFFVVNFSDFATYRAVWAKTNTNQPAPTDFYTLPGSGIPQVYRGDGSAASAAFPSTVPLRAGTYLTVGFDIADTQCTHYLGSQAASTGTINAAAGDADTPLLIGTRGDLFTKMKGDIAEILIYDRALTPTERTAVASYLGTKYGIANLLPSASLVVTPAGPAHAPGDVLTLAATASDPDGSITSVRFFANGSPVGTATAPPYSLKVRLETPGSYEFSARATDNKDGTADTAAVSRTVAGGGAPTLGVTTTLQLWLKADAGVTTAQDGTVVEWKDQSGKDNHAASPDEFAAPLLAANAANALPAIRFDGQDDWLEIPDSDSLSITGNVTSFFVVKMDDFATYRSVWAKTNTNQPAPTDFYTLPGSGIPQVYRGDGTGVSVAAVQGTRPLRAGSFDIVGFSTSGAALTHYLNGAANGSGASTTGTADLDRPLYIGTRDDFVTKLQGDLAELLIYDSALSAADLTSVQLYLATRYGQTLTSVVNDLPTVTLTAPAGGTSAVAPADITLSADALDADGSVVKVEFLVNGGVAATDLSAPWSAPVTFSTASAATLVARATDNVGGVSQSAPVSLTVTAAEPVPLPALASLRLWLRADKGVTETGGAVSAWSDQSGNFNNTVQTNPSQQPAVVADAVNGRAVLRFDGADDSLVTAHSPTLAITGDISSFFVVKFDDFDTFRAVWAKTNTNLPAPTDFYTLPTSGIPRVFRGNGGGSLGNVEAAGAPVAGEFAIVGFDMAGTTLRHFLNGGVNGQGEITATPADTGAPLHIGTRGDQFTRMKGDIAEIVIYDSALSDADRATIFDYLSTRYGIPLAATPQLSIVAGDNGTVTLTWPPEVTGWSLESSSTLLPESWQPVLDVFDNTYSEAAAGTKFFRLRQ